MTTLNSYVVSVKARKLGDDGPIYTRFEIQTSGGPRVASILAIQAAHGEGVEHVDVLKVRMQ